MASHNQQQLIPGLPNTLVLDCLLPRIPWHTRPRIRSVSKAWKEVLDSNLADYAALTRRDSDVRDGLVMVHRIPEEEEEEEANVWTTPLSKVWTRPQALSIYDDESKRWRLLPPIPALRHPMRVPSDCGVTCVDRKLFVMGGWDPNNYELSAKVYMLDLGSGLWQWERRSNMCEPKAFFPCTSVTGKIYVLGNRSRCVPLPFQRQGEPPHPEVYDVDKDRWSLLPRVQFYDCILEVSCSLEAVGEQVIAFGYKIPDDRSSMVWKIYDPVTKLWSDWDYDYTSSHYIVEDGTVHNLDKSDKYLWTTFHGSVPDNGCSHWVEDYAEDYLVVNESSKPHVYLIYRDSESESYSELWRGDMDIEMKKVAWRHVELPSSQYLPLNVLYVGQCQPLLISCIW